MSTDLALPPAGLGYASLQRGLGVFQERAFHLSLPNQPAGDMFDRPHAGLFNVRVLVHVGSHQIDGSWAAAMPSVPG